MHTHRPRPLSGPRVAFLRSPRLAHTRPRRGDPTIRDPPTFQTAPAQPVTQDHSGDGPRGPCRWPGPWGVGCCLSCLGNGQIVVHESQFFSNGAAATPSEMKCYTSLHSRSRGVEGAKLRFVDKVLALKRNRTPQRVSWGASCGHHPGSAPVRQIALGVGPPRGRLLRRAEAARSQMSRPSTWRAV